MAKKELDILFPIEKKMILGGVEFIIQEFRAKEFADVLALGTALSNPEGIAEALANDSERFFRLLSSTTGVPIATIEKMRLAALAQIVGEVMEQNVDFFTQSLPRLINKVTQAVTKNNGLPSSNS